ncbi:S8 family serine peptidase [Micromonospora sp. NPDC048898]|uniref:S53 family peptidase n=1 Tax=Micromonospora sp. NPDC048898 TaxID=3364260 RepID=UPI003713D33D
MHRSLRTAVVLGSVTAMLAATAVPVVAVPTGVADPTGVAPSGGRLGCATPTDPTDFRCFGHRRAASATLRSGGKPAGFGPADLRSAYRLPRSSTDATIAIVAAYDNPNAESDLAVYRATFGLPPCTSANGCFRKVNQRGAPAPLPAADAGWAGEISLDLAMVSAACPTCRILLVEADDASMNLITAVGTAVGLGAPYVSMSWGTAEEPLEAVIDKQVFDHPGVVFTAASGDSGYVAGPVYPASSPRVTAVGGTTLVRSHTPRGWTESAWPGSGSGCSAYLARPSFQHGRTPCASRATADVAAIGDPDAGVAVYQTYGDTGWGTDGGTSAGAPFIAGVYALAGAAGHARTANSYPYRARAGLFDVVSGSTGDCAETRLCTAVRGWDGPTGLGTPNGIAAFAPHR